MADEASEGNGPRRGLTRRALFKGAGAAAAAGAVFRSLDAAAEDHGPKTQGPGAVSLTLKVNGEERTLEAEPRETLLQVLRLSLDVTGPKPVCDRGTCGACTIWIDGEPAYACSVLGVEAEGREITTVEGLGNPDAMHVVQQAFVENDALQCGFCTPGFVMSCAHAVKKHGKDLTDEQVREACAGNLCRCGTYPHVVAAALAAAKKGS